MSFHPRIQFALLAGLAVAPSSAPAQAAASAVAKARSLYYTPVDAGLKSFHCDVQFDWKDFMQKASNQAVPEDDARLKYLESIHLSVDDDLRGRGEMHWNATSPAPDTTGASVSKIRDGMQQLWSGFFQSWNGFATGDLMTPDQRSVVEKTSDGYQVSVRTGADLATEQFGQDLTLKSVHVITASLESNITPSFTKGPQGLMVTSLASSYRQPPTAQPTDVTMDISYGPVGTFQLPATLAVAVGPAHFQYRLQNCTVQSQLTNK